MTSKTFVWIQENRFEFILLLVIFIFAAFFRLYKIDQYMTFLGDEGRDAIIVKKMVVDHNITFIGPPTSVGNIYSGPLYYYMMAVAMGIGNMSPVAAAVMIAFVGLLTIALIYYLSKIWFGKWPALVAAWLYAISPVTIIYSRSSWNPNPAPLFDLIGIWSIYKFYISKNTHWLFVTGIAAGCALQMHYLTMIMIPIYFSIFAVECIFLEKKIISFFWGILKFFVGFIVVLIPWLLFEIKHGFPNLRALKEIFFGKSSALAVPETNFLIKIKVLVVDDLIGRYMTSQQTWLALIILILFLITLLFVFWKKSLKDINFGFLILLIWFIGGVLGLSLYKGNIYDHYLNVVNPVPFILFGSIYYLLKSKTRKIGYLLLVISLTIYNLNNSPLRYPPNNQLQRTQDIAHYVISQANNKPFNFALLSANNYDAAYQFYLDQYGHNPEIVPARITGQLFVVCEDEVCNPVGNPKYEIAAFGMSRVESTVNFEGVKVYKLVANPSGKPS